MDALDRVLAHHGVKGMKWGVRRRRSSDSGGDPSHVTIKAIPGKKIQVSGGKKVPIHDDAVRTIAKKQVAKASGVHALSDTELKAAIARMNMEQQFAKLTVQKQSGPTAFIRNLLQKEGEQQVSRAASLVATQQVNLLLKKHGVAAAS